MRIIIYTSRARTIFTANDLADLRALAASANDFANITGLLVFDGKGFIQALEGDSAAVEAVMDRIVKDPRHDHIVFFTPIETEHRQFKQWSTEYRDADDLSDGSAFLYRVISRVAHVDRGEIKAAFIGFAAMSLRRRLHR
jgi:hypothetical protein